MFNQIARLLLGDSLRVFASDFILDEDVQVLQSTLFLALTDLFLSLWNQLSPSFLTGFDMSWDVGDQDGNDDLHSDYKMLKEEGQQEDIGSRPEPAPISHINYHGRLLLEINHILVLEGANSSVRRFASEEKNADVDRNGEEGDKAND